MGSLLNFIYIKVNFIKKKKKLKRAFNYDSEQTLNKSI